MRPVKERDWRDLAAGEAWRLGNLLDVRPAGEHAALHPRGAVNMPLPDAPAWGDPAGSRELRRILADRLPGVLLPPRHEPMLVLGPAPAAEAAAAFFDRRGRHRATAVILDDESLAALPSDLRESGSGQRRLWRPPAFLAGNAGLLPPADLGPAMDLGAGCGRAAAWLAAEGWRVTAVDRHRSALELAARVAASAGVEFGMLEADLTDPAQVPPGPWALAVALRFLERPLLERMDDLLLPGGAAVVRTYRWREEMADVLPARHHCLRPGELLELFPPEKFEILLHVEQDDPDGTPAAGVVARRR